MAGDYTEGFARFEGARFLALCRRFGKNRDDPSEFARYALAQGDEQARMLKAWVGADLLVLDDLFLARRISEHAAELLQALVHQRYKLRRSIVITSNRVVQDWGRYLGDATMATTILDRLMHRCAMLEFEGKSYRLKEAAARLVMPSD